MVAGELPTEDWLENCFPDRDPLVKMEAPRTRKRQKTALPSTPPEERAGFQERIQRGELPKTTPEQRRRNRMVPNTEYGTPPAFTSALRCGYISPNLPHPVGYRWHLVGPSKWMLKPQLGG